MKSACDGSLDTALQDLSVSQAQTLQKPYSDDKTGVQKQSFRWVCGTAVPSEVLQGFYDALREGQLAGSTTESSASQWLAKPTVPERAKAVLKPEIKKINQAADKSAALAMLAQRWGISTSSDGSALQETQEVRAPPRKRVVPMTALFGAGFARCGLTHGVRII